MDIEKILEWGTKYFSEYTSVFISTLTRPTIRFQPINYQAQQPTLTIPGELSTDTVGPNLNPKLFGFLIVSVFIGATLNSLIPVRSAPADIVTTTVVTLAVWFSYSWFVYGACKLLGGKGGFWATISVSLQLLAVIYVVSSFATLIVGTLVRLPFVYAFLVGHNTFLDVFVNSPVYFYFMIQSILMFIYLPFAVKHVHGFRFVRRIFASAIPLIIGTSCGIGLLMMTTTVVAPLQYRPRPTITGTAYFTQAPTETNKSIIAPSEAPSGTPTPTTTPTAPLSIPTP